MMALNGETIAEALSERAKTWQPDPAHDGLKVEVGPSGASYTFHQQHMAVLMAQGRDATIRFLGRVLAALIWAAHVRGLKLGDVVVYDSAMAHEPFSYVVVGFFRGGREASVGYDDMGTPCEVWPW